ncbi:DUF5050 domain-containing protein [Bacillus sp. CGMCC 1.16607]|uniref:DUF5050 domain-containing protein n=1 Tax=Bacillus sp. CGMCC 1.16607 TaxID=3351842 RepID=UPI00362651D6
MNRVVSVVILLSVFSLNSPLFAKEITTKDPDKVTREANGILTSYKDWVYYWGRNESEKETKVTDAFFREKLDGSGKMMLSDWAEKVWGSGFDIENESIFYIGYDYYGDKWHYVLKKMDLDGRNKQIVLDPFPFGGFQVEGDLVYSIGYDPKGWASVKDGDRNNGIIYRTNLKTKRTVVLKKCIYPRLWPITEKGIYIDDEFYPTNSTNPEKSKLKDVWKQIGHKSPMFLEVNGDSVFPDRGNIYYIIWSQQAMTQYLVKYNEESGKTTLIKELPKYGPHLRMVNIHRGNVYFEAGPYEGKGREIHRIPLSGGKLTKVMDIPNQTSFSIINNQIYFYSGENLKILTRIPLPH